MNERRCRQLVAERSGGTCEIRVTGVCKGRASDFSHRKARGQGGGWAPSNGLAACGPGNAGGCHGFISQHRAEGEAGGWRVPRHQDPARTPVLHGEHGWVILMDDGTIEHVCPYCLNPDCAHWDECGAELDGPLVEMDEAS